MALAPIPYDDWTDALLRALARFEWDHPGMPVALSGLVPKDTKFEDGWVRRAATEFSEAGWVDIRSPPDIAEIGLLVSMTDAGQKMARAFSEFLDQDFLALEGGGAILVEGSAEARFLREVPASDRVVRLDDNAPGLIEAIEKIIEIEAALASGSNELPLTTDERAVILSSISSLRRQLEQRIIRIGEIWHQATKGSTLIWLTEKLMGLAVATLATAAIGALVLLFRAVSG